MHNFQSVNANSGSNSLLPVRYYPKYDPCIELKIIITDTKGLFTALSTLFHKYRVMRFEHYFNFPLVTFRLQHSSQWPLSDTAATFWIRFTSKSLSRPPPIMRGGGLCCCWAFQYRQRVLSFDCSSLLPSKKKWYLRSPFGCCTSWSRVITRHRYSQIPVNLDKIAPSWHSECPAVSLEHAPSHKCKKCPISLGSHMVLPSGDRLKKSSIISSNRRSKLGIPSLI